MYLTTNKEARDVHIDTEWLGRLKKQSVRKYIGISAQEQKNLSCVIHEAYLLYSLPMPGISYVAAIDAG